jgi:hypothetical protein
MRWLSNLLVIFSPYYTFTNASLFAQPRRMGILGNSAEPSLISAVSFAAHPANRNPLASPSPLGVGNVFLAPLYEQGDPLLLGQ